MRHALILVVIASCWRGSTEPAPPAPVRAVAAPTADPPRVRTHPGPPVRGAPSSNAFVTSSPGPLTTDHRAWDDPTGCAFCHVNNTRDVSAAGCMRCHDHDPLPLPIQSGFHASRAVRGKACEACHREHKGRSYDLMGWKSVPGGRAKFDHALTGWPLPAAYRATRCTMCHTTVDTQGYQLYVGADRALYP